MKLLTWTSVDIHFLVFPQNKGRIDSLGATDSPSACFQSAFAREVVQNTRRSSSTVVQDSHVTHHGHHSSVMGSNPKISSIENSMASTLTSNSTNNGPTTSYNRNRRSLTASSKYRSQFAAKHHQANQQVRKSSKFSIKCTVCS